MTRVYTPSELGMVFFEPSDRREIEECLPAEAADDLEIACFNRLIYPPPPEPAQSLPAFLRVAKAARELEGAIGNLSPFDRAWLLDNLELYDIGRIARRLTPKYSGPGLWRSWLERLMAHTVGSRLLQRLLHGIEMAAEFLAYIAEGSVTRDGKNGPKIGRRPNPMDWRAMADVAAVCAANGINPSEASEQFTRVAAAVWRSAGRDTEPTHAIRAMRKRLRGDPDLPYRLVIPLRSCEYIMSVDSGTRFTSHRVSPSPTIVRWCKQSPA